MNSPQWIKHSKLESTDRFLSITQKRKKKRLLDLLDSSGFLNFNILLHDLSYYDVANDFISQYLNKGPVQKKKIYKNSCIEPNSSAGMKEPFLAFLIQHSL